MGQWSSVSISSMLLSVPLVIISTLGVISFLGTSLLVTRLSTSLSSSLSGSSPERISSYSYPSIPIRQPSIPLRQPSIPVRQPSIHSGEAHTRHTYHHRTRRSPAEIMLNNIMACLDCPDQLSCQVYKLSQSQEYPIMASIIRPLLEQRDFAIYEKIKC